MVLRARYGQPASLVRPTWYPRGRERWFPWEKVSPEKQLTTDQTRTPARLARRAKRLADRS